MHPTQATTECYQQTFPFQGLGSRRVEADFCGGHLSSDGGCLLLREMDRAERFCEQLASCFSDRRKRRFVEHDLTVMLRQRILGIAIPRQSMARWLGLAADWLRPIYEHIHTGVMAGGYVQIDEPSVAR